MAQKRKSPRKVSKAEAEEREALRKSIEGGRRYPASFYRKTKSKSARADIK